MDLNTSGNPNVQQQPQQPPPQQRQKAMDKLREAILTLSNSEPNVPLSETQNTILKQRLNHFLSCLHSTPDHPPYTWMIEKALQELAEEGGSSEDAISEFIRKGYDSLPWAHMTLLKHHIQKMSEKGEIVRTHGGRFLLPGDSKKLNRKRKRKRKYVKKNKRGNSEIKQKKPQHKEKEEEKQVLNDDVEEIEHLEDPVLQQLKLSHSRVEETNDISSLYPEEILENEQPGNNLPQLSSPEAPPGFEFLVEDATEKNVHTSLSVCLDSPKEDCVVHQSSEKPGEEESVAEDLLKTKKQQKKRHAWQLTNSPTRVLTRAQRERTATPNEPISGRDRRRVKLAMESSSEPKQLSREKLSETDRSQRQLKRWTKSPGDPKSASTSNVQLLPFDASADQYPGQIEEPVPLAIREEVLNLTDPQYEVHLEQKKECRGRLSKYKGDGAKIDNSCISALETNEEVLSLDDPQHEVHLEQQKKEPGGRVPKDKEVTDHGNTLLKNLVLSRKLRKKQNDQGGGSRRRKAQ